VWDEAPRPPLATYGPIFIRAALQVALVACNVVNIASEAYGWAFLTGGAVSYVWWWNSRTAAHTNAPYGQVVYTLGAGVGTVLGMVAGTLL
jgi:hypothetical protein